MGSGSGVPEKGINLNPDVIATDPEAAGELDYSERTRDNYRRQWELFEDWMGRRGRSVLPADPGDAAEYLRWRYEQGRTASTLRQSAGAIAYHHRKAGLTNPCDWLQVRTVLRSLGRKAGKGRGPESPLTDKDLKRIVRTAFKPRPRGAGVETEQRAQHRGRVDIALIRTMRDARLFCFEAAVLRWKDVHWSGSGDGYLLLPASGTERLLPESTLEELYRIRKGRTGEFVFGLGSKQIGRRIAAAARAAGLKGRYTGRSPCIGRSTEPD